LKVHRSEPSAQALADALSIWHGARHHEGCDDAPVVPVWPPAARAELIRLTIRNTQLALSGRRDPTTGDVQAALQQIDTLCATAFEISRRETVAIRDTPMVVSELDGVRWSTADGRESRMPELPVTALHLNSPLQFLAQLDPGFVAGGGLVAFLALAKRVVSQPIEIAERWKLYRRQVAIWEAERSEAELRILEAQALIIRARARLLTADRLALLDPDDPRPAGEQPTLSLFDDEGPPGTT
jgi:hypothetical protein